MLKINYNNKGSKIAPGNFVKLVTNNLKARQ